MTRVAGGVRWRGRLYLLVAAVLAGAGIGYLLTRPAAQLERAGQGAQQSDVGSSDDRASAEPSARAAGVRARVDPTRTRRLASTPADAAEEPHDLRSLDPDDLAAHFEPGDPEPTGAELIEALHEAGIHEGIGAFNPPGTSPPLEGVRVPDDYVLPEGFVRHHQVTDAGEPIDPILLFSPDFEFYDEHGQPIPIPDNRVVPPELAPPDMPIEPVRIPPPP